MEVPRHIAIIMDGNGRWAKEKGLPRLRGHHEGAKRVKDIIDEAQKIGIKALTIFAFSTENWSRPRKEIVFLFAYLGKFIDRYKAYLIKQNINFRAIGRRDRVDKRILKKIEDLEASTKDCGGLILNLAVDYGGRWDIVAAAKKMIEDYDKKKIKRSDIDEALFNDYLSLNYVSEPDLLIRTSGEQRISNFLIWDLAYSELYFTPVLWPDFNKHEFAKAINIYSKRDRRFGKIHE